MKYRKLRIAWSVAWGILCLLLIALWVRSHSNPDGFVHYVRNSGATVKADSNKGRVIIRYSDAVATSPIPIYSPDPFAEPAEFPNWQKTYLGFFYYHDSSHTMAVFPYWFAALMSATVAHAVWIDWRFSLRTLLIGMTVAAIGLGWIVYALRK